MAINPYVPATAIGNGVQVDFSFTFPYIFPAHVSATINDVPTTAFTFLSTNVLRFNTPPANGAVVQIFRETPGDELAAVIQPGGPLPIVGLNRNFLQSLYYNQETQYSAANQSTAGLQTQINALTILSNSASANAGAAVTTANSAQATASAAQATAAAQAALVATANANASNAVTTANAAIATAVAAAQNASLGLRNKVINGNFLIDQRRGALPTVVSPGTAQWVIDRWFAWTAGGSVTAQQINAGGTDPWRMQFTGGAGVSGFAMATRLESLDVLHLAGKRVTLSVNISNSLLTNVNWFVHRANTTDAFGTVSVPTKTQIATGAFTVNSTYSRYSVSFDVPANATTGLEISFHLGAQTSGTCVFGKVQLEEGPAATPFEELPTTLISDLCQRYYEAQVCRHDGTGTAGTGNLMSVSFRVPKRVIPSISWTALATPNLSVADARGSGDNLSLWWYSVCAASGAFVWHGAWFADAEIP